MAIRLTGDLPTYSSTWWFKRLLTELKARQRLCRGWFDFYEGEQPLAFASAKFSEVFGRRYRDLPSNFMPLVVDAERERLIVQGFRFGKGTDADKGVWKIWQQNQLDAESQIAHEIALTKGVAYTMVAPGPDGPLITIEDPTEVIVETEPGNRRLRRAALKVWTDDDGYLRANLFLPDDIFKYRSERPRRSEMAGWESVTWVAYADDDDLWPSSNPLGVVPIIPLLNRPTRDGRGRSEIAPVMGNQNAINKLRFDALVASEYVAFPQRWATNIDIPIDPDTGKPVAPFRAGVDNIWATRRPAPDESQEYGDKVPQPAFGQFPAGDLAPYIQMIESEVAGMSSISRTPYHYFLGTPTSIPPSGESLKSSEAPLVKKVVACSVHLGEGWEETMRLAMLVSGQTSKARVDGETIWADPETRNEAARTDSVLKQHAALSLPLVFTLEELGYSQQQIDRVIALQAKEEAEAEAELEENPLVQPPVNGAPIPPAFPPAPAGVSEA